MLLKYFHKYNKIGTVTFLFMASSVWSGALILWIEIVCFHSGEKVSYRIANEVGRELHDVTQLCPICPLRRQLGVPKVGY